MHGEAAWGVPWQAIASAQDRAADASCTERQHGGAMAGQAGNGRARPAVLDADESWHLPERVCVPARPDTSHGTLLDVRELTDGRLALPVYSSMEQLIACCGAAQPWLMLLAGRLPAVQRTVGFDVLLLDVDLPPELRRSGDDPQWHDDESTAWHLVYIPSRRFRPGDERALLELQPMPGDRLAVMAYSSEEALRTGCGPGQPWVSVPAGLLDEARRQAGADTIVLDTALPDYLWHANEGS